jgi:hypothetical protein
MYDHIADSIKSPTLIKLRDNLSFARFEILKVYSTLTAIEQLLAAEAIKPIALYTTVVGVVVA